jgi:hypothetical protein
MRRDEKYCVFFASRNLDAIWQKDNGYSNVRIEKLKGVPTILMTSTKEHSLGAGKKFFYDFDCDFCFEVRWLKRDPQSRKEALMSAMGF